MTDKAQKLTDEYSLTEQYRQALERAQAHIRNLEHERDELLATAKHYNELIGKYMADSEAAEQSADGLRRERDDARREFCERGDENYELRREIEGYRTSLEQVRENLMYPQSAAEIIKAALQPKEGE